MIESIRFKWADLTDRVAEGSNEHEILFGKMRERRRSGGTVNARSLMLLSRTSGRGNYEEEAELNRYQMIVRGWGGGVLHCVETAIRFCWIGGRKGSRSSVGQYHCNVPESSRNSAADIWTFADQDV